ncbi:MAG: VTT domain-containing protein [Thermodesulfobacteriota bacterium]
MSIPNSLKLVLLVTAGMMVTSSVISILYGERFLSIGGKLLTRYGQSYTDVMLYTLSAVSTSPLTLPVSEYAVLGTLLGFEPLRLITLIALGAMTGSSVSYLLGRFFGNMSFVRRRFPEVEDRKWTRRGSLRKLSLILVGGALSPIPVHPFYAACGMMRYPIELFTLILFFGWWVRIGIIVLGIKFISQMALVTFLT